METVKLAGNRMKTMANMGGSLDSQLWTFIREKLGSHREPIREGVPRGDLIGFSSKKYQVMLWTALLGVGPQELAREYNVTYDVLRQWRTELEFKRLVEKNQQEFTDRFVRQLKAKWDEARQHNRQPEEEELGLPDLHLYGPDLVGGIIRRIETITATSDIPTVAFWMYVLTLVTSPIRRQADPKHTHKLMSMLMGVSLHILKALLKKDPVAGAAPAIEIIEHIESFERLKLQMV